MKENPAAWAIVGAAVTEIFNLIKNRQLNKKDLEIKKLEKQAAEESHKREMSQRKIELVMQQSLEDEKFGSQTYPEAVIFTLAALSQIDRYKPEEIVELSHRLMTAKRNASGYNADLRLRIIRDFFLDSGSLTRASQDDDPPYVPPV